MSSLGVKSDFATYYVVSEENYNKYLTKKRESDVCVKQFPKRVVKRIASVLKYFSLRGIKWDILGCVSNSDELPKDLTSWNTPRIASQVKVLRLKKLLHL